LSIAATKFAGSIDGAYLPWTGASSEGGATAALVDDELPAPEEPQPAAITAGMAAVAVKRLIKCGLLLGGLGIVHETLANADESS
jgi:hypothetical protein